MHGFWLILVAYNLEKTYFTSFLLAFALIWLSQKIKQFEKLHESTRVHRTKVRRWLQKVDSANVNSPIPSFSTKSFPGFIRLQLTQYFWFPKISVMRGLPVPRCHGFYLNWHLELQTEILLKNPLDVSGLWGRNL